MIKLLGGKCGKCDSIDQLEFHHLVPEEKSFDISSQYGKPWNELLEELAKCELRCHACHKAEHEAVHGITMYYHHKCRCDICRDAWNTNSREYKRKRRLLAKNMLLQLNRESVCLTCRRQSDRNRQGVPIFLLSIQGDAIPS